MITKTIIKIAKGERHDVYTSCFLHRMMYANVDTRYYMAPCGFIGASVVSSTDLKISFVYLQKLMFPRCHECFVSDDGFLSKKACEYGI